MVTNYLGDGDVTIRSHFGTAVGFVGQLSATPEPMSLLLRGSGLVIALRARCTR
ncbi:MAG TPA: hypothetical protein VFA27_11905 [Vicinamibacterales bacterium]|nr:hypothetical protein [Vicinamibacterales bacterium]